MTDLQRDIGRHDEAIETLKVEVHAMRQDLAEIKEILSGVKGGWRALSVVGLALSAVMGACGAFLSRIFERGGL